MALESALFIGVDHYDNIGHLNYCSNDAMDLVATIVKLEAFSPQSGTLRVLTSTPTQSPTRAAILNELSDSLSALSHLDQDSSFLFYFAGHGIEIEGKPFLLPCDYDPKLPEASSLPVELLMKEIRKSRISTRVFIFDSCYSGIHRGERTSDMDSFNQFVTSFGRGLESAQDGTAVLSSASINEKARERRYGETGNGVFTASLISALQELHKRSADGEDILIEQLHKLAYEKTLLDGEGKQHPRFFYAIATPIKVFKAPAGSRKVTRPRDSDQSTPEQTKGLLRQLSSNNPELQRVAAERIIEKGAIFVPDLLERLGNNRKDIRNWAALCLGEIGDEQALLPLLGALRDRPIRNKSEPFAEAATEALRRFGVRLVPVGIDYLSTTKLNSNERQRVVPIIVSAWDGQEENYGKEFATLITKYPETLSSITPTGFVIETIFNWLKTALDSLGDERGKISPDALRHHMIFLFQHASTETHDLIRTHAAYSNNLAFQTVVVSASKTVGGELSLNLIKGIRELAQGKLESLTVRDFFLEFRYKDLITQADNAIAKLEDSHSQ